jgi:NADH-quinone oxidoreductase subunit K
VIRVYVVSALAVVFITALGLISLLAGGSRSLDAYLVLASLLFAIGMFGFLARRNAISMLMSIELMLNAVNLSIIAFGSFGAFGTAADKIPTASVIALLVMAVAAAEATVGLAIVIAIFRNKKTPLVDEYDAMRQ